MDEEANANGKQAKFEKKPARVLWPQWIAGIGVASLLAQIGLMSAWTSPYVAYLTSDDEAPFHINLTEASWVASLLNLGRLIGAIIGSICVNYLGSKTTILITSSPIAMCWICTIVANHVAWLYASRILGGISLGMTYSCFSLYIGEIANPAIRGALVSLGMGGVAVGNLLICVMGAYLPMKISGTINLLLCCVLAALFIWLPESPHHLIKMNRDTKARQSIIFYHRDCEVETEFHQLKKFIESSRDQTFWSNLKEFKSPLIRKALMLLSFLFMYAQMCGLSTLLFYMETILRSTGVKVIEPSLVVIIVMVCAIGTSGSSMMLMDRFGRRILMMTSCFIIAMALVGLGTSFQLLELNFDEATLQYLPIVSVIVFQVAVFIGVLSVPSAVLGEIFPPNIKCVAACYGSILAGIYAFVSAVSYQPLVDFLTEKYVFWLYAALMFSGVIFTYFFLPETKGKSLQQIQIDLMTKEKNLAER